MTFLDIILVHLLQVSSLFLTNGKSFVLNECPPFYRKTQVQNPSILYMYIVVQYEELRITGAGVFSVINQSYNISFLKQLTVFFGGILWQICDGVMGGNLLEIC